MCVHCRSPVATVLSSVLSPSGRAASSGRELQLHVPHLLHLCPAEYRRHQRRVFEGSLSVSRHVIFPTWHWRVLLSGRSPSHRGCGSCRALCRKMRCTSLLVGRSPGWAGLVFPASARESWVQSRVWKCQGVPRCCGCPEQAGTSFCWVVRAVFLPASGGTAFPLAGFCCGRLACPGLGERSEVRAPRFDLHCFNHPKQASPVHMQILSKCQTVSSFCVSFNSFIFFLVWQLLSYENQKQPPCLELGPLLICIYGFR